MKQLPPLDKKTFDAIVYEMENQESEAFFHPKANAIFYYDIGFADFDTMPGVETGEDFEAFCVEGFPLPKWTPRDGFSAMENFALSLTKPAEKDVLLRSLEGGRGVFRRFKDALDQFPDEVRGLWFAFKERVMGERVKEWYEDLGGELSFRELGENIPEDLDETILTDFSVTDQVTNYIDWIESVDRDVVNGLSPSMATLGRSLRAGFSSLRENGEDVILLAALDPEDQPVGFIWGGARDSACLVLQIYVSENFRRVGLGNLLVVELEKRCEKKSLLEIVFSIPSTFDFLCESLEAAGASRIASVLVQKI